MGGGTNSLHEVHLASVPRWSFHGEAILVKPGLQAAVEGSFPLAGGEGIGGDGGAGGTPLSALLLQQTCGWIDLEPMCECDPKHQISARELATEQELHWKQSGIQDFPKNSRVKSVPFYQHYRGDFHSYRLLNLHLDP